MSNCFSRDFQRAFTLIELLIVVGIIAILAAIGTVNYLEAQDRALRSADMANMHTVGVALQSYMVDYNKLPVGDQTAGPFASPNGRAAGNGPASGGSWNGVPWVLVDLKYVGDWHALFCPKYLKLYKNGTTIAGDQPRYHNFRYAYNSASNATGGYAGGAPGSNIMTGDNKSWLVRDLYLPADQGFYASSFPRTPADFKYPWGPDRNLECSMWADMSIKLVFGGTNNVTGPDGSH